MIDPYGLWVPSVTLAIEVIRGAFDLRTGEIVCGKIGGTGLNAGEDKALATDKAETEAEKYFKDKGYDAIPSAPFRQEEFK